MTGSAVLLVEAQRGKEPTMPLAGQVHACWKCGKRLPVDNVLGSVTVLCPSCKKPNVVAVPTRP